MVRQRTHWIVGVANFVVTTFGLLRDFLFVLVALGIILLGAYVIRNTWVWWNS